MIILRLGVEEDFIVRLKIGINKIFSWKEMFVVINCTYCVLSINIVQVYVYEWDINNFELEVGKNFLIYLKFKLVVQWY